MMNNTTRHCVGCHTILQYVKESDHYWYQFCPKTDCPRYGLHTHAYLTL